LKGKIVVETSFADNYFIPLFYHYLVLNYPLEEKGKRETEGRKV
jgi:hypothetical protein